MHKRHPSCIVPANQQARGVLTVNSFQDLRFFNAVFILAVLYVIVFVC